MRQILIISVTAIALCSAMGCSAEDGAEQGLDAAVALDASDTVAPTDTAAATDSMVATDSADPVDDTATPPPTEDTIEADVGEVDDAVEGLDTVDAVSATDSAGTDDQDSIEATDASDALDTPGGETDTQGGNVGGVDLASCKKHCAEKDLECTGVCAGSPLCLAQCAAANTECKDACDAAFDS